MTLHHGPAATWRKEAIPPKPAWRRPLQGMKRLSREFGQPAAEGRKTFVKPDAGRGVLPVFPRQNILHRGIPSPWQAGRQKKKTGPTVRVGPALMRYFYPVCGERETSGLSPARRTAHRLQAPATRCGSPRRGLPRPGERTSCPGRRRASA